MSPDQVRMNPTSLPGYVRKIDGGRNSIILPEFRSLDPVNKCDHGHFLSA